VRQFVEIINPVIYLAVQFLDFSFDGGKIGGARFGGDGFHHFSDGAEIVTSGRLKIDQRFERVDEQGINRLRLFAFCPSFLPGMFSEEPPPAGIDELPQCIVLELKPQYGQWARRVIPGVGGRGREREFPAVGFQVDVADETRALHVVNQDFRFDRRGEIFLQVVGEVAGRPLQVGDFLTEETRDVVRAFMGTK